MTNFVEIQSRAARLTEDHLRSKASTMTFTIAPEPVDDANGPFKWKGRCYHLTYSSFIEKADLLATVRRATTIRLEGWSYVHEDTSEDRADGTRLIGYQHTHFAVIFANRLGLSGSRRFDVYAGTSAGGVATYIHPNVQKVSMAQLEQIMTQYHLGRKYDVSKGATVYKEPVKHESCMPQQFQFNRAIIEEVVAAPSLLEACVAGEVRPRSVSDIRALRDESAGAAKKFKHKFDPASFKVLPVPPAWHFLHIHGGTGLGKTKWAVAQFKNPCVVKPFNSVGCVEMLLKKFDPSIHDGIVLDEADFRFMSVDTLKGFTDPDEDCTLTVRFKADELPPIRKIAVSNPAPEKLYPTDTSGAIARRVTTFHIDQKTYIEPVRPPPGAPLQPLAPAAVNAPAAGNAAALQVMRNAAANAAANAWGGFTSQ